jgi:hypothetical protein
MHLQKISRWGNSFRAVYKIQGTWKLSLYEVNGIDSSYLINGPELTGWFLRQFRENIWSWNKGPTEDYLNTFNHRFEIKFANNKAEIHLYGTTGGDIPTNCSKASANQCVRNVLSPESYATEWKIQKLTRSEIILTTANINSYKIKLNK